MSDAILPGIPDRYARMIVHFTMTRDSNTLKPVVDWMVRTGLYTKEQAEDWQQRMMKTYREQAILNA